jgi:hypothetical protein
MPVHLYKGVQQAASSCGACGMATLLVAVRCRFRHPSTMVSKCARHLLGCYDKVAAVYRRQLSD